MEFKSSKENHNVLDCAEEDLSFSGNLNLFKIKLEGNFSITIPANEGGPNSQTIYHNLGYEPAVIVFCDVNPNDATKKNRLPFSGGVGHRRRYCNIYTDRIVISVVDSGPPLDPYPDYARTFTGHYYIFLDPLPS